MGPSNARISLALHCTARRGSVVVARVRRDSLAAHVMETGVWPGGRVRVQLEVLNGDRHGAHALSTEPAALAEVTPPVPGPGEPTAADEYADYQGQAVPYVWGELDEDVDVDRHPTRPAAFS